MPKWRTVNLSYYIHRSWTFPSRKSNLDRENHLRYFIFIILFKLLYFTSIPKANSRLCRRGGRLDHASCLSPLSLPAALDISHQSRPNRGGAC